MNRADPIRACGSAPADMSTAGISLRHYSVEVAGPARHCGVHIVGHLFVMGLMTLTAFPRRLIAVLECRSPGVADQAVHILMC